MRCVPRLLATARAPAYDAGFRNASLCAPTQGGPTCYDERSCTAQPAYFTGTTSAPHAVFLSGIFTSSGELRNTQFADANTIWVSYCSSDAWAGDAAANFSGVRARRARWP